MIDVRTLAPLDINTIVNSIKKTGRVVICEEGCKTGGVGGEIWTQITEQAFDYLDAPIVRIAGEDTPIPFSPVLEEASIPDKNRMVEGIKKFSLLVETIKGVTRG